MVFQKLVRSLLFCTSLAAGGETFGQLIADSMFNGHDLSQWEKADGTTIDKGWVVENGSLFRQSRGGDIFYKEPVADFVFSFEWKISENGNSGVKYRVRKYGGAWLGCEYQLLHDAKNTPAKQRTAAMYALFAPTENKPKIEPNVWYRGTIQVNNNRIQHWINESLVVDVTIGSASWLERVQASKFRDHKQFSENQIGRIMLQDHGDQVWFRNLSLVRLSNRVQPSPSPAVAACPDVRFVIPQYVDMNGCDFGRFYGDCAPCVGSYRQHRIFENPYCRRYFRPRCFRTRN